MEKATIFEHLIELKKRLIIYLSFLILSFIFCYHYAEQIYQILLKPLAQLSHNHHLIYTDLTEAFFSYLKLSFFAGFVISFPILITQIYIFVAPALYNHEKKNITTIFNYLTAIIFFRSVACLSILTSCGMEVFLSFENNNLALPVKLEAKISEYLSLVMSMIIAFGLAFQLPIILTLLVRVGVITNDYLIKKRKYAIVIIFAVAAVITPPDVISQIGLAVPMMILYELSIFACKWIEKRTN